MRRGRTRGTYGCVESSPPEENVLQHVLCLFEEGLDRSTGCSQKDSLWKVRTWLEDVGQTGKCPPPKFGMPFPCMLLSPHFRSSSTVTKSAQSMLARRAESTPFFPRGARRRFSSTPRSQRKHIDHYATLSVPRTATKAQIKVLTSTV